MVKALRTESVLLRQLPQRYRLPPALAGNWQPRPRSSAAEFAGQELRKGLKSGRVLFLRRVIHALTPASDTAGGSTPILLAVDMASRLPSLATGYRAVIAFQPLPCRDHLRFYRALGNGRSFAELTRRSQGFRRPDSRA